MNNLHNVKEDWPLAHNMVISSCLRDHVHLEFQDINGNIICEYIIGDIDEAYKIAKHIEKVCDVVVGIL